MGTAVTVAIVIVTMSPEIDACPVHTLAMAQDDTATAERAKGLFRGSIGSDDRLVVVGVVGNFHRSYGYFFAGLCQLFLTSFIYYTIYHFIHPAHGTEMMI
jgi:hypothetical protein